MVHVRTMPVLFHSGMLWRTSRCRTTACSQSRAPAGSVKRGAAGRAACLWRPLICKEAALEERGVKGSTRGGRTGREAAERAAGERRTQELLACAYVRNEHYFFDVGYRIIHYFFDVGYRNVTISSTWGTETAGRGLAPDKLHVGKPSVTRKKSRNGRASRSLPFGLNWSVFAHSSL